MLRRLALIAIFIFLSGYRLLAQEQFSVNLVPSSITAMPGLHSGAFAEWNGKWVFIGGRNDGLHNFQTGLGFGTTHRNDSVFIVDPVLNTCTASSASGLPVDIFEAICSTNMEYYREGNMLYVIGGYGYRNSVANWITFPTLTAVNLDTLINAVVNQTSITSSFRQLMDTNLAVTGGVLQKTDSTYYLVFGHRFDGRYNRSDSSVQFVQHYTNEIRKFNIGDDGVNLSISNYNALSDTTNFHRRDLNVVPQLFPNGEYGFTAFAGVFRKHINLPFLTSVDITPTSTVHQAAFNENLNQYSTAVMPVYDSSSNYMHTIFFGGLSLYTLDTSTQNLVLDSLVPFVTTISKVTRDPSGNLVEYKLPINMPSLLGTNAIFIPDTTISWFNHTIVNLNSLSGNTHVGYLVGGIQSDLPNVADVDPDGMSRANNQVFDVYINKTPSGIKEQAVKNSIRDFIVYPNPSRGIFNIEFTVAEKIKIEAAVYTSSGIKIASLFDGVKQAGTFKFSWDGSRVKPGTYFCRIQTGYSCKTIKLVIEK